MKKIVLIILTTILSISTFAQKSILDEKNGFKTIKLGTDKSNFNNLTFYGDLGLICYIYKPDDKDLYYVFDTKYDAIILMFDKQSQKLEGIMLVGVFTGDNFCQKSIDQAFNTQDSFIRLFGKADDIIDKRTDNTNEAGIVWYGQKVFVSVTSVYFGVTLGKSETHVTFGRTEKLSNGF